MQVRRKKPELETKNLLKNMFYVRFSHCLKSFLTIILFGTGQVYFEVVTTFKNVRLMCIMLMYSKSYLEPVQS
jgi:hypothetical protein